MSTCARCSAPAVEAHHPSGRVNSTYLDADFTIDLCLACHRSEHRIRAALDLDKVAPSSLVEVVEVALRRVAVTLGRLADGPAWITRLAEACRRWADLLAMASTHLDHHHPGWRLAVSPTLIGGTR